MNQNKHIRLGHGSGGKLTHELVTGLFLKYFDNDILSQQGDSGLFPFRPESVSDSNRNGKTTGQSISGKISGQQTSSSKDGAHSGKIAFSTDAYVVDPIFFPGGNIGSLAVSGTVNDLAVTGADPRYLSAAFIIEEGFPVADLEMIVREMADIAKKAGVMIVAGDTKVVNKGKCDKVFITTSGVGFLEERFAHIAGGENVRTGDKIIVNGFVGDHGISILGERESLNFTSPVTSDAACLNGLIRDVTEAHDVHFMRDATRGGIATVLAELAGMLSDRDGSSLNGPAGGNPETGKTTFEKPDKKPGITIDETAIPVREEVRGICEVFGYDPLYMANEGKVVMVVPEDQADAVISRMRQHPLGRDSAIIGTVGGDHAGKVVLQTEIGGKRFLDMLAGEQLPRIC